MKIRQYGASAPLILAALCCVTPRMAVAQALTPPPAPPAERPQRDAGMGELPPPLPVPGRFLTPGATSGGMPGSRNSNPLATSPKLPAAPIDPGDHRFPINLATALRLSDARPLIVAAAQASVWVAEAELTRTKVLWIPTLNIGFDYIRHDGGGPDFNKGILTSPSVNFFYGGVGAVGTLPTVDAIFDPLAARQVLNATHYDIQAAKNDALQQTADAYFQVHQYRGIYTGALYTVERGKALVDRITQLSKDLVPRMEIDRGAESSGRPGAARRLGPTGMASSLCRPDADPSA